MYVCVQCVKKSAIKTCIVQNISSNESSAHFLFRPFKGAIASNIFKVVIDLSSV